MAQVRISPLLLLRQLLLRLVLRSNAAYLLGFARVREQLQHVLPMPFVTIMPMRKHLRYSNCCRKIPWGEPRALTYKWMTPALLLQQLRLPLL